MGNQDWTQAEEDYIKQNRDGSSMAEMAHKLGRSLLSVKMKATRLRSCGQLVKYSSNTHEVVRLPEKYDKAMNVKSPSITVFSDVHNPYVELNLFEKMIKKSNEMGIKTCASLGDFFNFEAFSQFDIRKQDYKQEIEVTEYAINELRKQFTKIYMIVGNHEMRLTTLLRGMISQVGWIKCFFDMKDGGQIQASDYAYMVYNNDWWFCHQKNYSKLFGSIERQICAKRHKHIVISHSHIWGITKDPSGRFYLINTGGLMDKDKMAYSALNETTFTVWTPGYLIIKDGVPHLFDDKI